MRLVLVLALLVSLVMAVGAVSVSGAPSHRSTPSDVENDIDHMNHIDDTHGEYDRPNEFDAPPTPTLLPSSSSSPLVRHLLSVDLVNCTVNGVWMETHPSNCTLGSSTGMADSSTGVAAPTGTWSCTPYSSCGFFPNCQASRNCTCSGGTCSDATKPRETDACTCQYTYSFQYGPWSSCSLSCGPGFQSRSSSCFRSDGIVTSDINCGTPETSRTCSNGNCLAWRAYGFTTCTNAQMCGIGTQTQDVKCWDLTLNIEHTGVCPGERPLSTQTCNLPHCYSWEPIAAFGACSVTCGVGVQTRTTQCWDLTGGYAAAPAYCGAAPATSQPCSPTPEHCYEWQTSVWSTCSQPVCGYGTRTRPVWCQDLTTGMVASDSSKCPPLLKPTESESCKIANCYAWSPSNADDGWGTCPATCGVASQVRTVTCMDLTAGGPTIDAPCGTPPARTRSCSPALPSCFTWITAAWGPISADCGSGTQTRDVYCYDTTLGLQVGDSSCSSAGAKPDTSRSATNGPCFSWAVTAWSGCSVTCGPGTRTRTVSCCDTSTTPGTCTPAVNANCAAKVPTAPIASEACQIAKCYGWIASAWGACSVTCSFGTRTRTYSCQDTAAGLTVEKLYCANEPTDVTEVCGPTTGTNPACTDSTLSTLVPSVGTLSAGSLATVTSFTLSVLSIVSSVTMTGSVSQSDAKVVWNPTSGSVSGLFYGTNAIITATVTAQSGATRTYTVTISRQPSNNALLASIVPSTSIATLSPAFVSTLTSYSIYVPDSITSFTVSMTTQHASATSGVVSWSPSSTLVGNGADTTLIVRGVAQDTTTQQLYTIVITRGKSSVAYLSSLSTGGGTLSPTFAATTYYYTLTGSVSASTDLTTVTAAAASSTSTTSVYVNQGRDVSVQDNVAFNIALDVGDNIVNVKVLAQDQQTFNIYKIIIHRTSSEARLAFLTTSAAPDSAITPAFHQDTYSYDLTVPASFLSINVYGTFAYKIVSGKTYSVTHATASTQSGVLDALGTVPTFTLAPGVNTLTIIITPETGTSPLTYTLRIRRLSSVSSLQTPAFSTVTLSSFDPTWSTTTYSYASTVPYSVSSTTLTVTPTYTDAFCQYTFNGITTTYVSLVNGVASSSLAIPVGDIAVWVNCISQDGLSQTLYVFNIHRRSNDASLKSLAISTGTLSPTFDTATLLGYQTSTNANSFSLQLVTSSLFASFTYRYRSGTTVTGVGSTITSLLPEIGNNLLQIFVTCEDLAASTTKEYQITIKKYDTNSFLSSLTLSVGTLLPAFSNIVRDYQITVSSSTASTTLSAVTGSSVASAGFAIFTAAPTTATLDAYTAYTALPAGGTTPSIGLNTGYTYLAVSVIAEDTSAGKSYYTVTVYRPAAGSSFFSLTAVHASGTNDYNPNPFVSSTTSYTLTLPYADTTLDVSSVLTFPLSTTTWSYARATTTSPLTLYTNTVPTITVDIGDTTLNLICTAEDSKSNTKYTIRVHRKSNDATLSFLALYSGSGSSKVIPSLTPLFQSGVHSVGIFFDATVEQSVASITLTAYPSNSLAAVQYSYNVPAEATGPWNSLNTIGDSLALVLDDGPNVAFVRVIAEDTSSGGTPDPKYFRINIHRKSSTSSIHSMTTTLATPVTGAVYFTPNFSPTVYLYRLTVPSSTTGLTVNIVPVSTFSTNTYSLAGGAYTAIALGTTMTALPMVSGDQTLIIKIDSEDGLTTTSYTMLIHRISIVTDLVSVFTSVGETSPLVSLSEPTNFYSMVISPTTSTLSFTPTLASSVSSLAYRSYQTLTTPPAYVGLNSGLQTGPISMFEGNTTVELRVTAEDTAYTRVYSFLIHRISSNAYLASITFGGTDNQAWSPTFTPIGFSYEVSTLPAIGSFTVQVAQQWPLARTSYTFNGGSSVFLPSGVASSSLTLLMADLAPSGVNTLVLTVNAEDGIEFQVYTVLIHRTSNDATIVSFTPDPTSAILTADGANTLTTTVPNSQYSFSVTPITSSAYVYKLEYLYHFGDQATSESPAAQFAAASSLEISVLAPSQSTKWAALAVGNNFLHFRVTAEDQTTQQLYTIKIHRTSSYTMLSSMVVTPTGSGITPTFDKDTNAYSLDLPNAIGSFTLNVAYYYPLMASVAYVYTDRLGTSGPSTLLGDGVTSTPLTIEVGISIIRITCVAEDTTTVGYYTLEVNRISNDPSIATVVPTPASVTALEGFFPPWSPSQYHVILSVAPTVATIQLTPTHTYPKSTMVYSTYDSNGVQVLSMTHASGTLTPALALPVGNTTVRFASTAEDGTTSVTYTIYINRISTESSIATIAFNGYSSTGVSFGSILPLIRPSFSSDILSYDVYLSNSFHGVAFSGNPTYPRADLVWTLAALSTPTSSESYLPHNIYSTIQHMEPGPNTFTFRCYAQDTVTTTDYVFTIYREGDLIMLEFQSLPTNIQIYPTPLFEQGLAAAAVSVSFLTEAIGVRARFYTAGVTTAFHMANPSQTVTLINNTITGNLPLTIGDNKIRVFNSIDPWNYTLTVTRAQPDIQDIQLVVSPGPALVYTPGNAFSSTTRVYHADVPFITNTVAVTTQFATPSAMVDVKIEGSGIDAQTQVTMVPTELTLKVGNNSVTVVSSLDGTYIFILNRLPADVVSLVVTAQRADGTFDSPIALLPTFAGGTMSYTTALNSVMRNISFNFVFNGQPQVTPSTVQFGRILEPTDDMGVWNGTWSEVLTSGSPTQSYALDVGINYFGIYSFRDGWYVFSIDRGDADVGGIVLTGFNWDGTQATLTQVPAFRPTALGPRTVNVRKTMLSYTVTTLFFSGTIALRLNEGMADDRTVPTNQIASNQAKGPFQFHTLTNTLDVISSIDGSYKYIIIQELGDVKGITVWTTSQDGILASKPTTPLFESGVVGANGTVYRLTVPYRTNRLQFESSMITSSSAFIITFIAPDFNCNFDNTINTTFVTNNRLLPVAYLPLAVGTQLFALYSYLDGFYYHEVHRLVPDILSLNLTLNPGVPFNSIASQSWFSPAVNFAPDIYLYTGSINYVTEVVRIDLRVTTPSEYAIEFVDARGLTTNITIATTTAQFDLHPQIGVNWLTITCRVDGIYKYRLTRRGPDLQMTPTIPQLNGFDQFGQSVLGLTSQIMGSPMIPIDYTPKFNANITSTSYIATAQPSYAIKVSYCVQWIAFKAYFLNSQSKNLVTLLNTSYTSSNGDGFSVTGNTFGFQNLTTGVLSNRFYLSSEGEYRFELNSRLDGQYNFIITRLAPDLLALQLRGWTQAQAHALILPTTPAFNAHQYTYELSVPYIIATIDIECRHARADATYRAYNMDTLVSSSATPTGVAIDGSTDTLDYIRQLPLKAGTLNRFKLYSSLDGEYTISIYRALPILRGIKIQANLLNQNLTFNSINVQLPAPSTVIYTASSLVPTFTRGTYAYKLAVPFTVANLRFQVDFSLDVLKNPVTDAALVANLFAASGNAPFLIDAGSGGETIISNLTYSPSYSILCTPSNNTIRFMSTLDGNYTIQITRSQADITTLVMEGESTTNSARLVDMQRIYETPLFVRPAATTDPMVFTLSLPWLWSQIRFRTTFTQYSSVTLFDTSDLTYNLLSGLSSPTVTLKTPEVLDLSPTVSEYKLLSLQDGLYRFIVTRAAPDMRSIVMWPSQVTCNNSSGYMLNTPLKWNQIQGPIQPHSGLFIPAEYTYDVKVQYAVTGVGMTAICGTTWRSPNVTVRVVNSLNGGWFSYECNSTIGVSAVDLPLVQGGNTIYVKSDADGIFEFNIIRLAPTLSWISFTGHTNTTPSFSAVFPLLNPTVFTPGQFEYQIAVPYISHQLSMNFTQLDTSDLNIFSQVYNEVQSLGLVPNVNLGTNTWSLLQGNNTFQLRSSFDGCYNFQVIRRAVSTITTVEVALTQPYQTAEHQVALADFGRRDINTAINQAVATSNYIETGTTDSLTLQMQGGYHVFCGCTGDVNGTTLNYPSSSALGTPRLFAFYPPFMGGWIGPYTADVIHSASTLQWRSTFRTSTTGVTCTINGQPFTLDFSSSTEQTASVPLVIGANRILCSTDDGIYDYTVTRGNGSWILPSIPFHLYANEAVPNLALKYTGVTGVTDLNVQFVMTQGSVTPSYFPVASPLMLLLKPNAEFTLVAPAITEITTTYLSFVRTGAASWAFDLAPIWNITVLPQHQLIWSDISTVFLYYSLEFCDPIRLTPTALTNTGGITVNVTLYDVNSKEEFPMATIVFPEWSMAPQPFRMSIPLTTTNRSVLMRATVGGPDRAHYIKPVDVPLTIQSRADFLFTGFVDTMFVSQAIEVTVTPTKAPDSDMIVNMTISDGAVFLPNMNTVYGYDYYAGSQVSYPLQFLNGSLTPQRFTIQVLPALVEASRRVSISFDIIGADVDHYFPLSNRSITVLKSSQMRLTSIPTQLTNRAVSTPITITLVNAPPSDVTVHISCIGGGYPSETSITWLRNDSLSKTFKYAAPYWFTGVRGGSVDVVIQFNLSGLDAGMYTAPSDIPVKITQIQNDVRAVEFFAIGPDGVDIDMSNNMVPFLGNQLYYEQQLNVAVMDPDYEAPTPARRRLLSTTPGANISVAARAVFITGATVYATLDNDYNGVVTEMTEKLTSGTRSSYFMLQPGTNYFHVNSTLDGPYLYRFNIEVVVNPTLCLERAQTAGLSPYGIATQSFVSSSTSDLVTATGQSDIANSNTTQILFCSTISGVIDAANSRREDALNTPRVAASLADDPSTSWVFLVLMGMYFALAVSSGIAVGRRKVLDHHSSDDFSSPLLSLPSVEENVVQKAGRLGQAVVKQSLTFLIAAACFSLPHLLLLLATARAFDMMLYHSFIKSISLEAFRLLVGFPHVFLPWIFVAVFQQARVLLRLETNESEQHDAETLPGVEVKVKSEEEIKAEEEAVEAQRTADEVGIVDKPADAVVLQNQMSAAPAVSDKYAAPGARRISIAMLLLKNRHRVSRAANWFAKLSSPHHPFALIINGTGTAIFVLLYMIITFAAKKPVDTPTNVERYLLTLVAIVVGCYDFFVFARVKDETKKAQRAAAASTLEQDKESVRKRRNALIGMYIVIAACAAAMVLLIVLIQASDITKGEYQAYVVPFSIAEGVCLAAILWLLHGAIRMQRRRMINLRNKWRIEDLMRGMRFGPDGELLDDETEDQSDYEDDEDEDDEDEDSDEEAALQIHVPTEAPSAVDILLDSAAFNPQGAVRSWTVPTESQAAVVKEKLHAWLLFSDIFSGEDGQAIDGSKVDLSDAQLNKLVEHGHGADNIGPAIQSAQQSGLRFAGVPDLLAYLDRLKAEREALEAKLAEEMAEITKFVNEDSDLLKRLPKHDGTPNGQSILSTEDAVRGLEAYLRRALEGPPLVNPGDPVAMEAAKAIARDNMLHACKIFQQCARRFATTQAFLDALKEPLPSTSQIPHIRRENLRLEDAQKIVNFVNEDTNLLRPKRGRLLLTTADAELILSIVGDQTYGPEEDVSLDDSSSSTTGSASTVTAPHHVARQLSVSTLPIPARKGRLLTPIMPRLPAKSNGDAIPEGAIPEGTEGETNTQAEGIKSEETNEETNTTEPASAEGEPGANADAAVVDSTGSTDLVGSSAVPLNERKRAPRPDDRTPLVDDIIDRLTTWQTSFLKFQTVDKLVDAFRTPIDTSEEDAAKEKLAREEQERKEAQLREEEARKAAELAEKAANENALMAKLDALTAKVDQLASEKELAAKAAAEAERLEAERIANLNAAERAEAERIAAEREERDRADKQAALDQLNAAQSAAEAMAEEMRVMREAAAAERAAAEAALAALAAQHQAEKEALERERAEAEERARQEAEEKAKADAEEAEQIRIMKEQQEMIRIQEEAAAAAAIRLQEEEAAAAAARALAERDAAEAAAREEADRERAIAEAAAEAARLAAAEAAAEAARVAEAEAEAKRLEDEAAAAAVIAATVAELDPISDADEEPSELSRAQSQAKASRRPRDAPPVVTRARTSLLATTPPPVLQVKVVKKVFGFGSGSGKADQKLTADELRVKRQLEVERKKREREEAAVAAFKAAASSTSPSPMGPVSLKLAPASATSTGPQPSRRLAAAAAAAAGGSPTTTLWSRLRVTPQASEEQHDGDSINSPSHSAIGSPSYSAADFGSPSATGISSPYGGNPAFNLASPSRNTAPRLNRNVSLGGLGSFALGPSALTPTATATAPTATPQTINARPVLGRRESRK